MTDPGVIWGAVFLAYVVLGALYTGILEGYERPPEHATHDSVKLQQWEARQKAQTRRCVIWSVGLVVLIGAWTLLA